MPTDLPPAIICQAPVAVDGDSVRCANIGKLVRMAGIDAPELPGHCRRGRVCAPGDGAASKAALAELLARGPVFITPSGRDKYGRIVARVTAGQVDLSCKMITLGKAIPRYTPLDCKRRLSTKP